MCSTLFITWLTYVYSLLPHGCLFLAVVRGAPPELVLRLVEDPEFRYEDFAPRGEQAPPTMRAQVVWSACLYFQTPALMFFHTFHRACCLSTVCTKFHWPVCVCLMCAGLLMGGPRLLSGQQTAARHGPAPGWKIPGTLTFNLEEVHWLEKQNWTRLMCGWHDRSICTIEFKKSSLSILMWGLRYLSLVSVKTGIWSSVQQQNEARLCTAETVPAASGECSLLQENESQSIFILCIGI